MRAIYRDARTNHILGSPGPRLPFKRDRMTGGRPLPEFRRSSILSGEASLMNVGPGGSTYMKQSDVTGSTETRKRTHDCVPEEVSYVSEYQT